MKKVYGTVGLSVGGSLGLSLIVGKLFETGVIENPLYCLGIGICSMIGGAVGVCYIEPTYEKKELETVAVNSNMRKLSYWSIVMGTGMTLAPLMSIYMVQCPTIILTSIITSSFVFGSCAYLSTRMKDVTMMKWKGPLSVGMIGLLVTQITNLGLLLFMGPNEISNILSSIDVYGGIGLFTALSVYDSYVARKMYEEGEPDHLICTTQLFLDFMNLFIRMMEAMARFVKD